jgi:hypothetical protein
MKKISWTYGSAQNDFTAEYAAIAEKQVSLSAFSAYSAVNLFYAAALLRNDWTASSTLS